MDAIPTHNGFTGAMIDLDETLQTVRTVQTDLLLELRNVGSLNSHDEPVLQEVYLGTPF